MKADGGSGTGDGAGDSMDPKALKAKLDKLREKLSRRKSISSTLAERASATLEGQRKQKKRKRKSKKHGDSSSSSSFRDAPPPLVQVAGFSS